MIASMSQWHSTGLNYADVQAAATMAGLKLLPQDFDHFRFLEQTMIQLITQEQAEIQKDNL